MPVKKVGMPFEAYPGPQKGKDGQNALFVRPKSGLRMTMADLENYCSIGYSLRKGEMTRVFQTFAEVASQFMSRGYTIETPIGIFEPKLEMKRRVTNPDEVSHNDVQLEGIQVRVSKSFKKALKQEIGSDGFRYVRKPSSSRLMKNDEHLLKALDKSLQANYGHTTVASFAFHSGLTDYSARKRLNMWCNGEKPLLKSTSFGRTTIYERC